MRRLFEVDHLLLQTESGQTLSCLCGEFQVRTHPDLCGLIREFSHPGNFSFIHKSLPALPLLAHSIPTDNSSLPDFICSRNRPIHLPLTSLFLYNLLIMDRFRNSSIWEKAFNSSSRPRLHLTLLPEVPPKNAEEARKTKNRATKCLKSLTSFASNGRETENERIKILTVPIMCH